MYDKSHFIIFCGRITYLKRAQMSWLFNKYYSKAAIEGFVAKIITLALDVMIKISHIDRRKEKISWWKKKRSTYCVSDSKDKVFGFNWNIKVSKLSCFPLNVEQSLFCSNLFDYLEIKSFRSGIFVVHVHSFHAFFSFILLLKAFSFLRTFFLHSSHAIDA